MLKNSLSRLRGKSIRDVYLYLVDIAVQNIRHIRFNWSITKNSYHESGFNLRHCLKSTASETDVTLGNLYCAHVFDLLGSGPICLNKGQAVDVKKIQNISAFDISWILTTIKELDSYYNYIEWQLDFKNGHFFDVFAKSRLIPNNESCGYDIKIPWELARCQHHPFLARLYVETGDPKYKSELICEMLDFIAFNPIGYGVNWKCTMDVAIRVSNWIMALDIINESFDNDIYAVFAKSIYQHCIYIRFHLEDQRDYRGNHYLSNIVGLVFASTFFSSEGIIKDIQRFAIKELLSSFDEQFYLDGGNFEGSLSYHRLSLELVIFGLWRIIATSDDNDLCKECVSRIRTNKNVSYKLGKAFNLMLNAVKPSGDIYQLGDNDSGHLFRFSHYGDFISANDYHHKYGRADNYSNNVWDENELCCNEIIEEINSILGIGKQETFLYSLLGSYFEKSGIVVDIKDAFEKVVTDDVHNDTGMNYIQMPYMHTEEIKFDEPIDLTVIKTFYYPIFGFVGLKSDSFYLGVSIANVGQHGRGGHSHNDKLSYDLSANGRDYQQDPGTYVYTESIEWRNKFRSSLAHNCPYFGEEQNTIGTNCFELKQRTMCELLHVSNSTIIVSCKYSNIIVIREFELFDSKISITDYSNEEFLNRPSFMYFSNGYGKLIKKGESRND